MQPTKQRGFTIIEVLIILAIATLILLVVLLAVPQLRRASRNTMRHHDAELIIAQRAQYNVNVSSSIVAGGFDCSPPINTKKFCEFIDGQLSYYDMANVTFHNSGTTAPVSVPSITDANEILTDTFYQCSPDGSTPVIGSSSRNAIILYAVETGGGIRQRCIETFLYPH